MREVVWNCLVANLQSGTCVLVLGPEIPATRLGEHVNEEKDHESVRDAFCEQLVEQLEAEGQSPAELALFAIAQQYEDHPAFRTVSLKHIAADSLEIQVSTQGPCTINLLSARSALF